MTYNPEIHHRRSIRLQGYDYSQAGAYFVSICTQNRECLFGQIVDANMRLNDAGRMVWRWRDELENKFPDIQCDEFICMPNHIHFVVVNVGADLRVRPVSRVRPVLRTRPVSAKSPAMGERERILVKHIEGEHIGSGGEHIGSPLRTVVQWFKTMTTNEYIRGVKQHGWTPFPGKLWQRNYWEHIVRNETDLNHIREYIHNNPAQWVMDRLNPVGANLCVRPADRRDTSAGRQTHRPGRHIGLPLRRKTVEPAVR